MGMMVANGQKNDEKISPWGDKETVIMTLYFIAGIALGVIEIMNLNMYFLYHSRNYRWVKVAALSANIGINVAVVIIILIRLKYARRIFVETAQHSKKLSNNILMITVIILAICGMTCVLTEIYYIFCIPPLKYPRWVFESFWCICHVAFLIAMAASLLPEEINIVESLENSDAAGVI